MHELREEDILSEDPLIRVNKIIVEEADREYYGVAGRLTSCPESATGKQLADDIHEAMRARWWPPLRRSEPQR